MSVFTLRLYASISHLQNSIYNRELLGRLNGLRRCLGHRKCLIMLTIMCAGCGRYGSMWQVGTIELDAGMGLWERLLYLPLLLCRCGRNRRIQRWSLEIKGEIEPWPVWLSWLGIIPQSERSLVRFLVRAHVWVVVLIPSWGTYERQPIDVSLSHWCFSPSLSSSLPLSLSKF